MRKLVGNILCWFVPSKLLRRKLREAIDFGIVKRGSVLREEAQFTPEHYLSICAIAKNEGCYFREWIEFHRLVGVDKFYIYDNESSDDTQKILEPYIHAGIVHYRYWPGSKQQVHAYADCVAKCKYSTRWLAFIDLDEFIVPVQTQSIPDILNTLQGDVSQMLVSWLIFGSNGRQNKPDGLVIENYRSRGDDSVSHLYKAIVNPRMYLSSVNAHYHRCIGRSIDEDGEEITSFHRKTSLPHSKIQINHYFCKSWEEYQVKRGRGSVFYGTADKYSRELFDELDRNEISDPIMDKYIAAIKARVASSPVSNHP
jgi:hypothetical protein